LVLCGGTALGEHQVYLGSILHDHQRVLAPFADLTGFLASGPLEGQLGYIPHGLKCPPLAFQSLFSCFKIAVLTHIHDANFLGSIKQVAFWLGHAGLHPQIGGNPHSPELEDSIIAMSVPSWADLLWSVIS
jgi:hypothetical protein